MPSPTSVHDASRGPRPAPLPSLTSLRALAVTGVFFAHAGFWFTATSLAGVLTAVDHAGTKGVLFFFMLSGAILAYNYPGHVSPAQFYRRRFARIYPIFILAFFTGAIVSIAAAHGRTLVGAWEAVANIFMLNDWFRGPRILPPTAWTLGCEALFYLLFPLLLPLLRRLAPASAAVAGVVLLLIAAVLPGVVADHFAHNVVYLAPLTRLPEFVAGCLIGLHLPSLVAMPALRRNAGRLLWACGLATIALTVVIDRLPYWLSVTGPFVPVCAFAIVAAAAADVAGPHRLASRSLVLLGLWSYAFYSFHASVLAVFNGIFTTPPSGVVAYAGLVGIFVLVWGISAGLYRWWEEPWRERLTRSKPSEATILEVPPRAVPQPSGALGFRHP